MEQTVYIDIFFLINFSMDVLCFFITSRLLSHRLSMIRGLIASAAGGIYACAALLVAADGVPAFLLDMAAGVLMSFIAVKKKGNTREVLGYSVVYIAVSALLGGVMTALFSFFNKLGLPELWGGESTSDGLSVWLFALLAALSGALALFGGRIWKKRSVRQGGCVEIAYGGARIRLDALCDSGNLLTEPISSKPCIIAEKSELEKILPRGMRQMIDTGNGDGLAARDAGRIRVIPTRTVNGSGMLYALRADEVRLNMGKGWCTVDVYVALSEFRADAGGAKALVPSVLAGGAP